MTARWIAAALSPAFLLVGCAPAPARPDPVPAPVPAPPLAPAAHEDCPIPGEMAHWQADFCMAQVGTDDVIAAGPCLEREAAIRFPSACNAKQRYKAGMCELAIANGSRTDSVEACVADPHFVGPTVRNRGA
jgi:hypothetical protein